MKTGDGIIREYRIVNGRQEFVRSVCLGGGVTVGGRGMDMSRLLSEMPRRDIGLKPRSEWGKKATSPKVQKPAAEKVVEANPVAEKPEESKAIEVIEAADGAAECFPPMDERGNGEKPIAPEVAAKVEEAMKEAEAATAAARAAVKFEEPPNDLFDAMEYAGVVVPELPAGEELKRPAFGETGRKKHRKRRRRR